MWIGFGENSSPISDFILHPERLSGLRGGILEVSSGMRTLLAVSVLSTVIIVSPVLGGKAIDQPANERTVFVTGSLIPQRIKLKPIGTTTVSPIRIVDRREIDATGRRTTRGALIADPSVRVLGH